MPSRLGYNLPRQRTLLRWSFVDGFGSAFGIVTILPPLEMVSPLEMLRNQVGCGAAFVAAVVLILTVDLCVEISEVVCHCRPQ